MESLFPFGFPFATGLYLTFYVVTLTLHVVFMNYVLTGTAYLAFTRKPPESPELRIRPVLASWMPLMLSGAITAGIAPLLFVQILYKQSFYTANLLLFNRWMSILPALILGFYALYLAQSGWLTRRPHWLRVAVAALPFACVAYTGYSWTENHLLSLETPEYWGKFYGAEEWRYYEPQLIPRLLVWAFGAMPVFALVVAWQLFYRSRGGEVIMAGVERTLSFLALAGLALAGASAVTYWSLSDFSSGRVRAMAGPYFVAAVVGCVIQAAGWLRFRFERRRLFALTAGTALTVLGMTATREAIRLDAFGPDRIEPLMRLHEDAANVGGIGAFLVFFVLNAGLITLCVLIVRNGRKQPGD